MDMVFLRVWLVPLRPARDRNAEPGQVRPECTHLRPRVRAIRALLAIAQQLPVWPLSADDASVQLRRALPRSRAKLDRTTAILQGKWVLHRRRREGVSPEPSSEQRPSELGRVLLRE